MTTSILELRELQPSQSSPHVIINEGLRRLEAAINIVVVSQTNTPPASPAAGARYLVGTSPTGAWVGKANAVAFVVGGVWQFHTPQEGWIARVIGDKFYYYSGSAWVELTTGGGSDAIRLQLACSDLTTNLTVADGVGYVRAPAAFTITAVRASLGVVSSSGAVEIDIRKNGTTIFSTKLTIDASSKTSVGAATPAVVSTPSVADDDELIVDIDGAGTGAKGLIVTIIGTVA